MIKSLQLLLAGAVLLGTNSIVFAQFGSLDNTFDTDGKVTTSINSAQEQISSVLIQNDGKIVAAGLSTNGTNYNFALARYNSNGSLDITFDTDGKITTDLGDNNDVLTSAALQSDGKIVAVGFSGSQIALVRYNENGSLDNTFDTDGKVFTTLSGDNSQAFKVAIQKDGKIVITASSFGSNSSQVLVRYNENGSLDENFGNNGVVDNMIAGFPVAIQEDGKIIVGGTFTSGGDFALARFNSDGTRDMDFGVAGISYVTIGFDDIVEDLAIQKDGKIVLVGYTHLTNNGDADFALARFNNDGSLDTDFDSDGKVTTTINTEDRAYATVILDNGKIIAAGFSGVTSTDFALVCYNTDGSVDNTFGADGVTLTPFGSGNDIAFSAALQSDGKIVVGGYATINNKVDFGLARYNGESGTLSTFNENLDNPYKLYPNPSTGIINVSSGRKLHNATIKLLSIQGHTLFANEKINGTSFALDISMLETGFYILEIAEGENVYREKVVKH